MKTNYKSALARIQKANTSEQLRKLEKSLCVLYECQQLTEKELARLDCKIMEKLAVIAN